MKKPKQAVLGVRVKFTRKKDELMAEFFIEKGLPSKTFLTNPLIQEAAEEYLARQPNTKERVGHMELKYTPETKMGAWTQYYPFRSAIEQRAFGKRGIAEQLELITITEFERIHRNVKGYYQNPSGYRTAQMQKRRQAIKAGEGTISRRKEIRGLRRKIRADKARTRIR